MKKVLLTVFMLAATLCGTAQESKKGVNALFEEYAHLEEGKLTIKNPEQVIISTGKKNCTVSLNGEYNGYAYDVNIDNAIEDSQFLSISSSGIEYANGDTIVIANPEMITFSKNKKECMISVTGVTALSDKSRYTLTITQSGNINESKAVYKETDSSWNFNIPFVNNKRYDDKKPFRMHANFTVDPHFGFGVVGATAQADGVDLSMSNGGFEFILDELVGVEYHFARWGFVELNFGVNWRNYRMIGDKRFIKENDRIEIADYPTGANIRFSRIKTFSLTVSLMYQHKFNKYFGFSVGSIVNFNTGGNIKTRWSVNDEAVKDRQYDIHQTPVTVDFCAQLHAKCFTLYYKYSPNNVLKSGYGPEFRSMSAGLMIGF